MKSNQLIAMLVGVLFITTGITAFLVFQFHAAHRRFLETQAQLNTARSLIQAISADAVEYSKKNPAIDPILRTFNIQPGSAAPSAPAGKPATR